MRALSSLLTAALLLSLAASVTADEPPTPTTDEAPPTPSDQQPEQPERCEDSHSDCKGWVVSGECANNPSFMHAQCRRACGLCSASAAGDELDWKTRLLERWQALTLLLEGWRAGLTPPQQQLLSALTAAVVALVSAVLWVWWQRREQHVPTAATAAAGLGSADLSNVREQRLSTISRSHSKPSAAREAPPPAERPPVSPPAERPPAFWKRFVGSGGGGGGDGGGGGPRPWHPAVFVMDSKRILCIIWTLLSFAALFSMWTSTRCKRLNLPRSLVVYSHGMAFLTYESQSLYRIRSLTRIAHEHASSLRSRAPSLATTGAKVQLIKLFKLVTSLPLEGRVKEIVTRLNSRTIAAQDAGAR